MAIINEQKKKKNYNTIRPIASQMAGMRVEDRMEEKRRKKKRQCGKKNKSWCFYMCMYVFTYKIEKQILLEIINKQQRS